MTNKTLIFKKIPTGLPVPGEHLAVEARPFDLDAAPPPGGQVLELLYASLDPYLRGLMGDPNVPLYEHSFPVGTPFIADVVARVLKSDGPAFEVGDLVVAQLPIAEYATVPANPPEVRHMPGVRKIANPFGLDPALFLGPLGMPGLTAYSSLYKIGKPKAGETILVSSAAGAVGQIVGQLAKREGLKVIGSVGSDEKLAYIINELGFDGGFNYKKESPFDAIPRLAPEGLDIYYESVGGEHLEAALISMNTRGRIPFCGLISEYNVPESEKRGIKGLFNVVEKEILIQGFIVDSADYGAAYYQEHQDNMQRWLHEGSIKAKLDVTDGIDNAPEGLVGMLVGKNFGKAVLKIRD